MSSESIPMENLLESQIESTTDISYHKKTLVVYRAVLHRFKSTLFMFIASIPLILLLWAASIYFFYTLNISFDSYLESGQSKPLDKVRIYGQQMPYENRLYTSAIRELASIVITNSYSIFSFFIILKAELSKIPWNLWLSIGSHFFTQSLFNIFSSIINLFAGVSLLIVMLPQYTMATLSLIITYWYCEKHFSDIVPKQFWVFGLFPGISAMVTAFIISSPFSFLFFSTNSIWIRAFLRLIIFPIVAEASLWTSRFFTIYMYEYCSNDENKLVGNEEIKLDGNDGNKLDGNDEIKLDGNDEIKLDGNDDLTCSDDQPFPVPIKSDNKHQYRWYYICIPVQLVIAVLGRFFAASFPELWQQMLMAAALSFESQVPRMTTWIRDKAIFKKFFKKKGLIYSQLVDKHMHFYYKNYVTDEMAELSAIVLSIVSIGFFKITSSASDPVPTIINLVILMFSSLLFEVGIDYFRTIFYLSVSKIHIDAQGKFHAILTPATNIKDQIRNFWISIETGLHNSLVDFDFEAYLMFCFTQSFVNPYFIFFFFYISLCGHLSKDDVISTTFCLPGEL